MTLSHHNVAMSGGGRSVASLSVSAVTLTLTRLNPNPT